MHPHDVARRSRFIKVLDFGIAKFTAPTDMDAHVPRTATGVWMGTAEYMAPEMYRGEPPDGRVDVYALGVLLYKLITGETPFKGAHLEVAVEQSRRGPAPPSERAPDREVPAEIDALLLRALARDLNSRTPSMTALRGEIAAALAGSASEEHERTLIRKRTPLAAPASTGRPAPPVSITPAPAEPTATSGPVPAAPAPASEPPVSVRELAPVLPAVPPRSVAVQTEPHRIVSGPQSVVAATEVIPSKRRMGPAALVAGTFVSVMAVIAVGWRLGTRGVRDVEAPVEAPSVAVVDTPAVHAAAPVSPPESSLAPAPTSPTVPVLADPAPPPASLAPSSPPPSSPVEPPGEVKQPAKADRPVKPRPSPRAPEPAPPPADPRPAALTEQDVGGTFKRLQRECVDWGVPRGRSATLNISISSEGSATYETIGIADPFFVDCLGKKLKQTKFPESHSGGRFRHGFTCG
ncbi:serine/threonine protein kinase [Nannocystis punicea]|uniref:non-specific serine/threonine protein kinase n=1 Tax=Nannocystis punicea TaxID=2995304 RepID=A0ABY7HBS8_9BACT|nr:protein kinase [Nannocystis poenicansa]WAS96459.1 protein kinase [Nannocystis poenicansa]